jgi:CDP-glucose 4,6-dehydratase
VGKKVKELTLIRSLNNKNILITGFEGFLGSHLTKELIAEGANVVGLDIKTKRKETLLSRNEYKNIKVVKGSVVNADLVKYLLTNYSIDIVFHLAAEAIVGNSVQEPIKTFTTNIAGTWTVLESCRKSYSLEAIIIASSDKAYGSHKKLPYREDTSLRGDHPYDVSKSCADLISYAYYHTYRLPLVITRCGNIYGPGDFNFCRIVPEAICCMLSGRKLIIRSDGEFTRDYVYVKDIVNGYILLAKNLVQGRFVGESFNFSSEEPISVKSLVEKIYGFSGKKPRYQILNKAAYEIRHQYLASGKARKTLGWNPSYTLTKGLQETIAWYRKAFTLK